MHSGHGELGERSRVTIDMRRSRQVRTAAPTSRPVAAHDAWRLTPVRLIGALAVGALAVLVASAGSRLPGGSAWTVAVDVTVGIVFVLAAALAPGQVGMPRARRRRRGVVVGRIAGAGGSPGSPGIAGDRPHRVPGNVAGGSVPPAPGGGGGAGRARDGLAARSGRIVRRHRHHRRCHSVREDVAGGVVCHELGNRGRPRCSPGGRYRRRSIPMRSIQLWGS